MAKRGRVQNTWNATLLSSVPPGVVTSTRPDVAPAGTVAVIKAPERTLTTAAAAIAIGMMKPVLFDALVLFTLTSFSGETQVLPRTCLLHHVFHADRDVGWRLSTERTSWGGV